MWAAMPRADVTVGFFRIQMLIALGLSILSLLTVGRLVTSSPEFDSAWPLFVGRIAIGLMAFVAYVGSVLWILNQRPAGTGCCYAILTLSVISLLCTQGGLNEVSTSSGAFLFASRLSTAAVLGGAVTGMLLGHWYLTAPTMSIEPLKTLSFLFGVAVVIRLLMSVAGWWLVGDRLSGGTQFTWFAMRWFAGIIGPLVISWMALRILRYRNTQAATGVLFAGVILTFLGEMSAALLYSDLHVPL